MAGLNCLIAGSLFFFLLSPQATRETIPDAVAHGATGRVATVPSGSMPTVAEILRVTDVIVTGILGESHSYLSNDERDIYTDYRLVNPEILFQSELTPTSIPGVNPAVTLTQIGGTVNVRGTLFTHKESALLPLEPGMYGMFFLQRVAGKYLITGKYFGAFKIADGRVMPMMASETFAHELRGAPLSAVARDVVAVARAAHPAR